MSVYADNNFKNMEAINSMQKFLTLTITNAKEIKPYKPSCVAVHRAGRGKINFMPRIGNNAHSAESNNGYARKPSGGFYCH